MKVYRAIDDAEKADFDAAGRFRLPQGAGGVKYFALSVAEAELIGRALMAVTGAGAMWLAEADLSLLKLGARKFTEVTQLGPVEAVALSPDDLRKLAGARIISRIESSP